MAQIIKLPLEVYFWPGTVNAVINCIARAEQNAGEACMWSWSIYSPTPGVKGYEALHDQGTNGRAVDAAIKHAIERHTR